MRALFRVAVGACALVGVVLAGMQAEAACSRASATGFGLAKEMAMEMAKMNLDAAIAAKGQKASGRTSYKCSGPMLMSECTATRRACS
jgi:hypothetical protein